MLQTKSLQKLVDRCTEMDITEQINCLGDPNMPYQAKVELDAIVQPWTSVIMETETDIPVTKETLNGFVVIEITSLEQLRRYFREGSYLRISSTRGFWLHVPME